LGFIHEGVRLESELMNEAERLRDLLDGSMEPSELESYKEYYKLAERIYGSEALDEIGVISPKEVEEKLEPLGNSEFTHDVILPSPRPELKEENLGTKGETVRRRTFLMLVGIIGLILISSNIFVGIDSILDLCEDAEKMGDVELVATPAVNGNTLTIFWSAKNVTIGEEYSITWDISQNGSQELVSTGGINMIANGNSFTHSTNATVQTEPYSYSSNLLLNGTIIATAGGSYESSEVNTMSTIQTTKLCEDNPRLKLTEIGNYKNVDSWGQVGEGEIIDGMLLMIFAFISLFGMTKKKR